MSHYLSWRLLPAIPLCRLRVFCIRVLSLSALASMLTGCAYNSVFINYPTQLAPHKYQLQSATPAALLPELAKNISSNDGLLYAQEAGRIAQIGGDFTLSKTYYQQAINAYAAFDNKATLSASDLGSTASSILLNDNAIPYRGPGFERVMLHQYQALNYLFSHDAQAALVEVRLSNALQNSEQERYQQSNESVQAMANGAVDSEINRLNSATGEVSNSFLNAYSYYITGLLHELLGEPNDAFIDYRKAVKITPGNRYLQQDLVRLAKQLGMPQYEDFKRRWGDVTAPKSNQGQVVMIVERGFVPEKQSFTVPIPLHGNFQTTSFATYSSMRSHISNADIQGFGTVLMAEPIANIDALAINALKEDLPYALVRQAARIYAKSKMNRMAESNRNPQQVDAGAVLMQIFNVITEQADRRSWLTLPQQAQIARQYIDSGKYDISLSNSQSATIEVQADRTTLIWAIETGNYTRFYSIIL